MSMTARGCQFLVGVVGPPVLDVSELSSSIDDTVGRPLRFLVGGGPPPSFPSAARAFDERFWPFCDIACLADLTLRVPYVSGHDEGVWGFTRARKVGFHYFHLLFMGGDDSKLQQLLLR